MAIYIPNKIKIGYQDRSDTYTKRLAYVIYYDEKGNLRKETSWQSWRDKKIEPDEYENEPVEGFVLNKTAGGKAYSTWECRKSYVRVYDPRGFEIEITTENLLFILENASSIKGKGLEGKFVYGWDGTELILIPTDSLDYKNIKEYSKILNSAQYLKPSELKIGYTYTTKKGESVVYMGRSSKYYTDDGFSRDEGLYYWFCEVSRFTKENKRNCAHWCYGLEPRRSASKYIINCEQDFVNDLYQEMYICARRDNRFSKIDNSKDEKYYLTLDDCFSFFKEYTWTSIEAFTEIPYKTVINFSMDYDGDYSSVGCDKTKFVLDSSSNDVSIAESKNVEVVKVVAKVKHYYYDKVETVCFCDAESFINNVKPYVIFHYLEDGCYCDSTPHFSHMTNYIRKKVKE